MSSDQTPVEDAASATTPVRLAPGAAPATLASEEVSEAATTETGTTETGTDADSAVAHVVMTHNAQGEEREIWADDEELDPQWNKPSWTDRLTAQMKALIALGVVLAMVLGIWAAGGFKPGKSSLKPTAVGTPIVTGPFEVTLIDAFLVQREPTDPWKVTVRAWCRNVSGTTTIVNLSDFEILFLVANAKGTPVKASSKVAWFGAWNSVARLRRTTLPPNMPPMPCAFQGEFAEGYTPENFTRVGIKKLEQATTAGHISERWLPVPGGHQFQLPTTVVKNS